MQNQADVEKWLGYTPRSTRTTAMCVSNALSDLGENQEAPSSAGEKFTWEIDYLLDKIFKVQTMVNTTKLLTAHKAIEHVKSNEGTYLAVLFLRKDFAGKEQGKNPKKTVQAGGISHLQVWKMPDPDDAKSGRLRSSTSSRAPRPS
jgi:hypothetical protein